LRAVFRRRCPGRLGPHDPPPDGPVGRTDVAQQVHALALRAYDQIYAGPRLPRRVCYEEWTLAGRGPRHSAQIADYLPSSPGYIGRLDACISFRYVAPPSGSQVCARAGCPRTDHLAPLTSS